MLLSSCAVDLPHSSSLSSSTSSLLGISSILPHHSHHPLTLLLYLALVDGIFATDEHVCSLQQLHWQSSHARGISEHDHCQYSFCIASAMNRIMNRIGLLKNADPRKAIFLIVE